MVSPSEGNEVRQDGSGSRMPHSSVEAGERALPDPVERRGCRVVDRKPEPRRGHRTSVCVTVKPTDRVEGQRICNVTSRMRLRRARPDLWEPWGRNRRPGRELDREHDEFVVQKLLAIVQPDFQPATWEAFQLFALDGIPAARVAEELGLTVNAVLQAKSRILKRLREEAGDLLK